MSGVACQHAKQVNRHFEPAAKEYSLSASAEMGSSKYTRRARVQGSVYSAFAASKMATRVFHVNPRG